MNANGRMVVATAPDSWSFFVRLAWAFIAIITLGFVVRAPNLLVISAPLR